MLGKANNRISLVASFPGFLTDTSGNGRELREKMDRDDIGRAAAEDAIKSASLKRVIIIDANQVYDGLNLGRRIDVVWPDEFMRSRGGRSYWQNWVPEDQMEGLVSCELSLI